ncbi:Extracellular ligand-binding receptor [Denitrovibrio acetiphilus DSM 12809]|uniref:Extracellular ligand-binding receptor n=1 Tax=Denitrovibrio acetiphilus (strain DSM 12809 / NBRC 114555 / N2460) TaxID=522772 RepID=D4H496_DENA2|nr:ABC transporter substrate-binding protein [Denitrovibrio acetiphilus]ADD69225.1 Extracellular ligand-binding receptor [Denitrovibrio acetiphilus DSM 12809]
MKKILFIILVSAFAASAYAEIRLGALLSVTGGASFLGDPEKSTLEMLIEQTNAAGGINGEKIKLFIYDTQGREDRAINYINRLAQKDKVLAIIGPSTTGESLAVINRASGFKVPLISCAASARIVTPPNIFVYKTPQSDVHIAERLFSYLADNKMKTLALLSVQNGFGQTGRNAVLTTAEKYGIEIVADEKYMDKDKDVTVQLSKIKDKNADAVLCWAAGGSPAIVARNAAQLGIKNLYMSHGVASPKFIDLAGDAANGIKLAAGRIVVTEKLDETDKYKAILSKYTNDYEQYTGKQVSQFGGYAYDAFTLFKAAYMKSGKNRVKLAQELQNLKNVLSVTGEFNMTETDHNGLSKEAAIMLEIRDGQFIPLK